VVEAVHDLSRKKGPAAEKTGEAVKIALTVANPKTRYTVTPEVIQNLIANAKRMVDMIIARRA
jgi:hypothetical protein